MPANMEIQKIMNLLQVNGLTLTPEAIKDLQLVVKITGKTVINESEIVKYYEELLESLPNGILDLEYDALTLYEGASEQKLSVNNSD
jgi:hypothetical protein